MSLKRTKLFFSCLFLFLALSVQVNSQTNENSKPWVFWYWMQASVSKTGITADLEAMKEAGIGGAYLMPIKGAVNPPLFTPVAEQLSPQWWEMVKFAMKESERLGLKLGMHVSDGFALAGGPWISPELSMQKVVSTQINIHGGVKKKIVLPQPETNEDYYKDIAVFAYPSPDGTGRSTRTVAPKISTSLGVNADFLIKADNKEAFKSSDTCWIKYEFEKPFTCRTITIRTNGNNYQAHRLLVEVSDDGKSFRLLTRLEPPRHGWQDTDADVTHVIPAVSARFFKFSYDKTGSEPGAEDLDAAKWKPSLKLVNLELSAEPRIHQYEGKAGLVWRISRRTTAKEVPANLCVPANKMINISDRLNPDGSLTWDAPKGQWTILRLGHTSTGHTNATGGAGKGLESDKFNPEAIRLQFNSWYGEALKQAGPDLASRVLSIFHVDSWECGSQNWSPVFRDEFRKRRGYDLLPYLPAMAGIPVQTVETSENFLYDVRKTIAELVVDKFYKTLAALAKEKGVKFTAESVAPTMISDGLMHYKMVDIPMGEFWLNSPTHDKPNDMLDAISGAHIYGKKIIQAEAFTTVRMDWSEHPGMLKTLQDRNYALGINKLVYHVFTHNPWLGRKPGMTLDGVGLYFQRDQTWWRAGKAWVEYAERCQQILQQGRPVVDIGVFTGEEVPRRSVLPDRLVSTMPGIFGREVVRDESQRLANKGEPLRQIPDGVNHSANMADPENWVNPLRGYHYDSFNPDVLSSAKVQDGRVVFPGGANYALLVIPGKHPMNPEGRQMSVEVASKLLELVKSGATVLLAEKPMFIPGIGNSDKLLQVATELWEGDFTKGSDEQGAFWFKNLGKGRIIKGAFGADSFNAVGIERDVIINETSGKYAKGIAWAHRETDKEDFYFISNQQNLQRQLSFSFRIRGYQPELFDAVSNERTVAKNWHIENGRTILTLTLPPNASLFVIFKAETKASSVAIGENEIETSQLQAVEGPWEVTFDPEFGGGQQPVVFTELSDWSKHNDSRIKYYSGTAVYTKTFTVQETLSERRVFLDLGKVSNIADVKINGVSCGVAWTPPYRVDITKALTKGSNQLTIEISNTWANRLIGDDSQPEAKRITKTTAPFRLKGKPLLEAGLLGPVTIQTTKY